MGAAYQILISLDLRDRLEVLLKRAGYDCLVLETTERLTSYTKEKNLSAILLSSVSYYDLGEPSSTELLQCIVLTDSISDESGFSLKNQFMSGEYHPWKVNKNISDENLLLIIAKACVVSELQRDITTLKSAIGSTSLIKELVAVSPIMRELIAKAHVLASYDTTVLINGESGTGKTALASYIHKSGNRAKLPFISISCAAIPRDLLEAELFGFEKGAFTGATSARAGAFELADGGTLFLDEIGDMPLELQPKLLTVLQDKTIRRLGSTQTKKCDVRIITATNKDLKSLVKRKEFREDLLFRLNVINLTLPPLRERKEDIPLLMQKTVEKISDRLGRKPPAISKDAISKALNYEWRGNVRELENVIERALVLDNVDTIGSKNIEIETDYSDTSNLPSLVGIPLVELEKKAIQDTINFCNGDKKKASEMLGISLKTIYNRLK